VQPYFFSGRLFEVGRQTPSQGKIDFTGVIFWLTKTTIYG
jgi:hypothetical protein